LTAAPRRASSTYAGARQTVTSDRAAGDRPPAAACAGAGADWGLSRARGAGAAARSPPRGRRRGRGAGARAPPAGEEAGGGAGEQVGRSLRRTLAQLASHAAAGLRSDRRREFVVRNPGPPHSRPYRVPTCGKPHTTAAEGDGAGYRKPEAQKPTKHHALRMMAEGLGRVAILKIRHGSARRWGSERGRAT